MADSLQQAGQHESQAAAVGRLTALKRGIDIAMQEFMR
jgi:hypothetical protein